MTDAPLWEMHERPAYWSLQVGTAQVTIEPRPPYCDRGHWYGKVFGLHTDSQDGFPRYFMDLDRAKAEMSEWLAWRLKRLDSR